MSELALIKVIGVGGGGGNAVKNMISSELKGVHFVCANTDAQAIKGFDSDVTCIQIGDKLTQGLGAGANPQVGKEAAQESLAAIKEAIIGSNMLFVTAGMGGGTGTGAAPVVAQAAKELGILTVGIVTRPFGFEGDKRKKAAEQGIAELRQYVDSLIVIPNERLLTIAPKNAKLKEMFLQADNVLNAAVRGISDLITNPGYINLDFADVTTAMRDSGLAMMGTGHATGETRAIDAARMAITSPLLDDISISGAKSVIVNISASDDMTISEFQEAAEYIKESSAGIGGDAHIFIGMSFDESLGEEVIVTVIATGVEQQGQATNPVSFGAAPTLNTANTHGQAQSAKVSSFAAQNPNTMQLNSQINGKIVTPAAVTSTVEENANMRARTAQVSNEEMFERPTFARVPKKESSINAHNPGKEEFILDDSDFDIPAFIRRQAN